MDYGNAVANQKDWTNQNKKIGKGGGLEIH